ncbi:MAG: hypothetical protein LBL35_08825 [Clostridiales bacterium]|jgi:hypothetical protein|nr:hypothetical protein [Clostridiales bacterium]
MSRNISQNRRARAKKIAAGIIAGLIAAVLLFGAIAPFVYGAWTETDSALEVTARIGYSGVYKPGGQTPIHLSVKNGGAAFSGKAKVKINVRDMTQMNPSAVQVSPEYNVYSASLNVAPGGESAVEIYAVINNLVKSILITLENEKGEEVFTSSVACEGVNPENYFAGALTDDHDSLAYLKQLSLNAAYSGSDRALNKGLVFLDEANFPSTVGELNNFNMIILNDWDTGKLSETKKGALLEWLKTGGTLVIGAGANYPKTLGGIGAEFFEIESAGEIEIADLSNDKYRLALEGAETAVFQRFNVKNGSDVITYSGQSITTMAYNGDGIIILHPFDLSKEPFVKLAGRDEFLTSLYAEKLAPRRAFKYVYSGAPDFSYIASWLPYMGENKITVIFFTVFAYAIAIGPIMYLILKKRDARERGFIAIPAIAALTTAAIFVISSDSVYKRPIFNLVSYVSANGDDGRARSFVNVSAPWKGDVNVTLDGSVKPYFQEYYQSYYYFDSASGRRKNPDIKEMTLGEAPVVSFYETKVWEAHNFGFETNADVGEGIKADLRIDGKNLKGKLTNSTGRNLKDLIIVVKNCGVAFNDIKNGETVEVDAQLKNVRNAYMNFYLIYKDTYGDVDDRTSVMPEEDRRWIRLMRDMSSMIYDYKINGVNNYAYSAYPISSHAMSAGSGGAGALTLGASDLRADIFAYSDEKFVDAKIKINGGPATELYTTVYVADAPVGLYVSKSFDLPYGFIGVGAVESDAPYSVQGGLSVYMTALGDLTVSFPMPEGAHISEMSIIWDAYATKEIYNAASGEWEPFVSDAGDYMNDEIASEDIMYDQTYMEYFDRVDVSGNVSDYVEDGVVKARAQSVRDNVNFPMISVKGEFPDA